MAKLQLVKGTTSYIAQVFIQDSTSTTGAGKTGLAFNTSSFTAYYHRDTDTTATAISLVTMTVGTFTSSGFKEIDSTNMPGWYQLCPPNAALASGAKSVGIHLQGATGMAPLPLEIELTGWDNQDAVHGGLSALPNAAAGATNGLPLSVDSSGRVDVLKINGTTQTARDLGASVLLSAGSGTGQLDFTSGVVKANLAQILATALTETSGQLAGGFKKFFNISTPAATMDHGVLVDTVTTTTTATTATNLTNAPSAGDFTATMKTSLGTAVAASAVASVTGNVGGNVTGSVGSVVGAVGSVTGNVGGNVTGSVGSVGTAGISSASFSAGAIDAAAIATNAIGSAELASTAVDKITAGVFAHAFSAAYGAFTFEQQIEIFAAALAGKLSGAATTTATMRNLNDTADVIVATVDANGNRTAVTLTP